MAGKPGSKGRRGKPQVPRRKNENRNPGDKEILYGYHSVFEALKAGRRKFESIMVYENRSDKRVRAVADLAGEKQVAVQTVAGEELDRLAGLGRHQGIAARVSPFPVQSASALLKQIETRMDPFFILILESIEDPQNTGALIRTALCADVDYIVMPKDRCALPSAGVSRSSAGAMEHAPIFLATNLSVLIRDLKKYGAWVAGLDAGADKGLFEADLTGNLALVVGGEHTGLRPGVRKACDFILSIPMETQITSLNASVAGGIAMFEARRQRLGLNF
ncbi:23S rRNA (guanosine(2251)-2'-O)-methyltransferase RlmB [Desulfobacter hydrogenophilus]|uniref:23S rRNA (Guanosine(2251)-2'-O)-methyltransferase RlmB n=1 Tax=Desulfobacter hydrogenophilus TaxID=2291 RepID=A0A328FGF0_9BACT|nr:23S rRNA (guanosine(2251)-2'-O)-methyltransferase RlmB [Desulfobacter hydrogenophilus]NDY71025.1 23S rRNA (guanosine(2251)-2'-O)-methyltransferase RlmB [Desulfobacter hydrogenophilus]QBH11668.1 23S rRNA (guanosine(2251)-2'-O)-methyltransferase RlmB [Desulfobacter hydrogenophilus]RAM02880.1 23S rRNA (guanosine(2251)-2'-O)-methyltransferase RlmB [Desulfobacter hydrogenophilus]